MKTKKLFLIMGRKILHLFTKYYLKSGFESLYRLLNKNRLTILMYHGITDKICMLTDKKENGIIKDEFEKQIKFLVKRYNFTTFKNYQKQRLRNSLILTFDDGYKNNYAVLYPILKRYNLPATIFLTTSSIGKRNYLSWKEIKEMQQNNIEFGAHTLSHPHLTEISLNKAGKEILNSKKKLEKKLKEEVLAFSYPYGDFNNQIKELVKNARYDFAVTVRFGKNTRSTDKFKLKRIPVYDRYGTEIFILSLAFNIHSLLYNISRHINKNVKDN